MILDLRFTITLVKRSPGFYLRNTTSLRKKEKMAMLRIKVCMNIICIVSDIYAHFLIPKIPLNSPGHCWKYTFVMKTKLCYQWRSSTYTAYKIENIQVALFRKKKHGTPFRSYLISFILISTLFLYCVTPMEHFFKHV